MSSTLNICTLIDILTMPSEQTLNDQTQQTSFCVPTDHDTSWCKISLIVLRFAIDIQGLVALVRGYYHGSLRP
jgi:hypothetical protein